MAEPGSTPDAPTPSRRSRRGAAVRNARVLRPTWLKVLAAALLPTIGLVGFMVMGEEARERLISAIPTGVGQRALRAAAGLAMMMVLAWIALPIGYGALRGTSTTLRWFRSRRGGARVLTFPFEVLVTLLSGLAGTLFYSIAVAIVGTLLLTLLMSIWILMPDLLGGYEALAKLLPN